MLESSEKKNHSWKDTLMRLVCRIPDDWLRMAQSIVDSAFLEQVVLWCLRLQAEQARKIKPLSCVILSPVSISASRFSLEFLLRHSFLIGWWLEMCIPTSPGFLNFYWEIYHYFDRSYFMCKSKKTSFLPKLLLMMVFYHINRKPHKKCCLLIDRVTLICRFVGYLVQPLT